jgi:hypothetical protein
MSENASIARRCYDHIDLRAPRLADVAPFYEALLPALGITRRVPVEGWLQFEADGETTTEFFGVTESPGHLPNETASRSGPKVRRTWIESRRSWRALARAMSKARWIMNPVTMRSFLKTRAATDLKSAIGCAHENVQQCPKSPAPFVVSVNK